MNPTNPLRIGAVNYLNSKPLIHRFDELAGELAETQPLLAGVRLLCDLPSRLADSLAAKVTAAPRLALGQLLVPG